LERVLITLKIRFNSSIFVFFVLLVHFVVTG
jgi:hypothetical protein